MSGNLSLSGSKLAAGYDLHSAYDYEIAAHGKVIAKTDLQIRVPDGTYGRIAPRSGLAAKHFIDIGAGADRSQGDVPFCHESLACWPI